MKTETVLITGAASGIGLALAKEFAKHGHNLVLTSRVRAELREVAGELTSKYNVEVGTIAADLEDPNGPEMLFDAIRREAVLIDILVNNAGLGFRGRFWEIPIENQLKIVRVNDEAVVRMTHLFLPQMIRRNQGRIMNTASLAGFEPGPLLAVYHASKAFVLSFTEALATELQDTAITVTALCPGPVDTDFFPKAEMMESTAFQKGNLMAPQEVAETAFD